MEEGKLNQEEIDKLLREQKQTGNKDSDSKPKDYSTIFRNFLNEQETTSPASQGEIDGLLKKLDAKVKQKTRAKQQKGYKRRTGHQYQLPPIKISSDQAIKLIKDRLRNNAMPGMMAPTMFLYQCFESNNGLSEIDNLYRRIDEQTLEEALNKYVSGFFRFCQERNLAILYPERFKSEEEYLRVFDKTVLDFFKSRIIT